MTVDQPMVPNLTGPSGSVVRARHSMRPWVWTGRESGDRTQHSMRPWVRTGRESGDRTQNKMVPW